MIAAHLRQSLIEKKSSFGHGRILRILLKNYKNRKYTRIQINDINFPERQAYRAIGTRMFTEAYAQVSAELESYLLNDGAIDGGKLVREWFSQIKADIFISHSHADQDLALHLAAWLWETFGLIAFVDSTIWGCGDSLLKKSTMNIVDFQRGRCCYDKRNKSTSLVHMVLATAIGEMVEQNRSVFFPGHRQFNHP